MAKAPHWGGRGTGLLPRVIQCPRTGRRRLGLQEKRGHPLFSFTPYVPPSPGPLLAAQDAPQVGGWAGSEGVRR